MKLIDILRYFWIVILFCVLELIDAEIGLSNHPASYDKISLWAFLITILWAIRDGQRVEL